MNNETNSIIYIVIIIAAYVMVMLSFPRVYSVMRRVDYFTKGGLAGLQLPAFLTHFLVFENDNSDVKNPAIYLRLFNQSSNLSNLQTGAIRVQYDELPRKPMDLLQMPSTIYTVNSDFPLKNPGGAISIPYGSNYQKANWNEKLRNVYSSASYDFIGFIVVLLLQIINAYYGTAVISIYTLFNLSGSTFAGFMTANELLLAIVFEYVFIGKFILSFCISIVYALQITSPKINEKMRGSFLLSKTYRIISVLLFWGVGVLILVILTEQESVFDSLFISLSLNNTDMYQFYVDCYYFIPIILYGLLAFGCKLSLFSAYLFLASSFHQMQLLLKMNYIMKRSN